MAAEQKDQLQVSSSLDRVPLNNKEILVSVVTLTNKSVPPYKNMPTKFSSEGSFELDVHLEDIPGVVELPDNFQQGFEFVAYPIGGDRLFIVRSNQDLLNAIGSKPKILKLQISEAYFAYIVISQQKVFEPDVDILTVSRANTIYDKIENNNKDAFYNDPNTLIKSSSTSPVIEKFRSIAQEIELAEILKEKEKLLGGEDGNYVKQSELTGIRNALNDEALFKQLILGGPEPK